MRITFCLNGPNELNGPNAWLQRHLPRLRGFGISPEILYLDSAPGEACRQRDDFVRQGFPLRSVELRRCTEDSAAAICAVLRDTPPDIFVPNYSVPAYFACRFLREAGVITVGVLHSDDPYYEDIGDLFIHGTSEWRLSAVVAVSEYLERMVRARPCGDEVPVLLAPCGTPILEGRAVAAGERFRILYLGRIVEQQKRIMRLARRMCAVAEALPNVDAQLYGAGAEREALVEFLARASPDGRVSYSGSLPADQVLETMVRAQAFMLLSDFEGLSVALLEAMSSGLVPIIAPFRSGATDVIRHGENGFIVDPEDEAGLIALVRRLSEDREWWTRLSTAARATIRDGQFSSDACADRWANFCRDLVAVRRSAPGHISLPAMDEWNMPARCMRANGLRVWDRRRIRSYMREVAAMGRPIFLWGAGKAGRDFLSQHPEWLVGIRAVVDSDARKHGAEIVGKRVVPPTVLTDLRGQKPFVVIASQFEAEIGATLRGLGYTEDEDFVAG